MTAFATPRQRLGFVLLLGMATAAPGCDRILPGEPRLAVATAWTAAERDEVDAAFRDWLARDLGRPASTSRIRWVVLDPGDDPSRILSRPTATSGLGGVRIDVVLGGPATSYAGLARRGRWEPPGGATRTTWRIVRTSAVGLARASRPTAGAEGRTPASPDALAFDDPRRDPIALAWADGLLTRQGWAAGYARLVREAGQPRRIGRRPSSSLAALARGEVDAAPAIVPGRSRPGATPRFDAEFGTPPLVEGMAIVKGGRNRDLALAFLRFLAGRGQAAPPDPGTVADDEATSLLADLLGATLVDAQDELRAAWEALARAGHPTRAEMWMTQAPPWPPASIRELIARDSSGALLQTLAAEIAPEPDVRGWLLRSWLGPSRLIDGDFLKVLAAAADGRLAREPRLIAWLRAEWTAWARQRYRRVARTAGGLWP